MNIDSLSFHELDFEGVKTLVKWAEEEGWNPGPNDAEVYYATDSEGYYGFYDEDTLIAGGAIVSYNGEFGFMGLFIVKPEFRGQKIGRKFWYRRRDTLLSRLKEGASIGMVLLQCSHFMKKAVLKLLLEMNVMKRLEPNFRLIKIYLR